MWESDGTTEGTKPVKEIVPFEIVIQFISAYYSVPPFVNMEARYSEQNYALNDKIYFWAGTLETGREVWVSDGSENGTNILKDILPGSEDSGPLEPNFVAFDGKTFFTADDQNVSSSDSYNYELWVTDGTENGTQVLKDITPEGSTYPRNIVALSDRLVFTSSYNLWVTDGTANGTVMQMGDFGEVRDISPPHKDQVFLYVENPSDNYNIDIELWVTDGLQKIPKKVVTMAPHIYLLYFHPHDVTLPNGKFSFITNGWMNGTVVDLWATDGTPGGTERLLDKDGIHSLMYHENLRKTTFVAIDNVDGAQLWETDGTPLGTRLLKGFYPNKGVLPGAHQSSEKDGFALYFVDPNMTLEESFQEEPSMHEPLEFNWELWASDGTMDGTVPLNFTSTTVSRGFEMASLNSNVILFERGTEGSGQELWKVTRTVRNVTTEESTSGPNESTSTSSVGVVPIRYIPLMPLICGCLYMFSF